MALAPPNTRFLTLGQLTSSSAPNTIIDTTTDATDILTPENMPTGGASGKPTGGGIGAFSSLINYLQGINKPNQGGGGPVSPFFGGGTPPNVAPAIPKGPSGGYGGNRPPVGGGGPVSPYYPSDTSTTIEETFQTEQQQSAISCYAPCDSAKPAQVVAMSITGVCPEGTLTYPPDCDFTRVPDGSSEMDERIRELMGLIDQQQEALDAALASGNESASETSDLRAQIEELQKQLEDAQAAIALPDIPVYGGFPPEPAPAKRAGMGNMGLYVIGGGLAVVALILLVTRRAPAPIQGSK